MARGVIDDYAFEPDRRANTLDVLISCAPVDAVIPALERFLPCLRPNGFATDAGSVKAQIVAEWEARHAGDGRFVGSHPMAGSEKRGAAAAAAELFVNRPCFVTPGPESDPACVEQVATFWRGLGAQVSYKTPAEHDAIAARISHLPHAVAAAMARTVSPADLPFAGGGLRDSTRIAAGDPGLWRAILLQNRSAVLAALGTFAASLEELCRAVENDDAETLDRILSDAKRQRDALGS
jgi:prephenate dehydrogenase